MISLVSIIVLQSTYNFNQKYRDLIKNKNTSVTAFNYHIRGQSSPNKPL